MSQGLMDLTAETEHDWLLFRAIKCVLNFGQQVFKRHIRLKCPAINKDECILMHLFIMNPTFFIYIFITYIFPSALYY